MKLLPFVRIFFAPDDGGGDGGAAVAEVPASADAVLADLNEFSPPDLNTLGDAPLPEEKQIVEPKKEEKPVEPKPGEKKVTEPPAKQLRDELERTRKERDEFKAKYESHPRVKELEASIAEREKELETIKAEVERTRKELDIRDPLASAKLTEHVQAFDKEYARSIEFIPELEGQYKDLVAQFAQLPRNDREQYRTALGEFESKVEELVGGRKFGPAMEFIRKGHDWAVEHDSLRRDVTENASKIAYESRESEWKKQDGEISSLLTAALEVPDDLEETDPYNPALFVKRALGQLEEPKQKEVVSKIDTFVKRVFAGPKPKTEKDFPGLSPQEIQERLAAESKAHGESKQAAVRMMKQGMLALTMLRPILSDYAKLKERVKAEGEATPPNPNGGSDPSTGGSEDLADYTPPSISI